MSFLIRLASTAPSIYLCFRLLFHSRKHGYTQLLVCWSKHIATFVSAFPSAYGHNTHSKVLHYLFMCWSIRRSYIPNMYLCVWSMFEQSWPDFRVRPNNTNWPQGHYLRNEFQTSPGWTLYTGLKNKLLRSGSVCSHPLSWLSIMDTHGHTNIIKNVSVWGFIFSTCPSFVIFDSSEIMATIKQSTSAFNTNRNYVVSHSFNLVNNLVSL